MTETREEQEKTLKERGRRTGSRKENIGSCIIVGYGRVLTLLRFARLDVYHPDGGERESAREDTVTVLYPAVSVGSQIHSSTDAGRLQSQYGFRGPRHLFPDIAPPPPVSRHQTLNLIEVPVDWLLNNNDAGAPSQKSLPQSHNGGGTCRGENTHSVLSLHKNTASSTPSGVIRSWY